MKTEIQQCSTALRLSCLLILSATCAVFAQPHYMEVGTLPIPTASERGEVFDAATKTWFSFPYYNSGDLTLVYSSQPGTNDSFTWTQTTSFPSRTTYWGRGASDGATLYFTGNIDGVSKYAGIAANGLLGAWQSMSALPNPAGPRGRSLHQAFIYNGRLYISGGWHGDGLPAYADAYHAPIQGGGALGSFVQTTSLPTGVASFSATVSPQGMIYVVGDTNLFTAQIAGDGSIGSWTTEPPIPGLRHNNLGNTAVALVSNLLVVVDYTNTFACRLDASGHLEQVVSTIPNPAYFYQRSAYASNGKVYVTATSGKVYRIDDLPFEPPFCSPHKATATATVVNGFVVGATITDPGCGYTNAPTVLIQGGGGSGAMATAVVSNGVVVALDIVNAGSGYTSVPTIHIASPPFVPTVSIAVSKVKVTQNVVLGWRYVLEASTDLVNWTATGPEFTAESETIVSEFDVDVSGRFFRIRQVP